MTEDTHDFIKGATRLIAHYGTWPSFHDADYVTIHVDMDGPTLLINFRLYDWDDTAQKAERPNVSLLWHGVEDLTPSGIEELGQNAIGGMQIEQVGDMVTTLIESTGAGTRVELRATSVEVTRFDPHELWDYETRTSPE